MTEDKWEDVSRGWNTDHKCPHCDQKIRDLYEYLSRYADEAAFDCPHCEKPVELQVWTQFILQRPRKKVVASPQKA